MTLKMAIVSCHMVTVLGISHSATDDPRAPPMFYWPSCSTGILALPLSRGLNHEAIPALSPRQQHDIASPSRNDSEDKELTTTTLALVKPYQRC